MKKLYTLLLASVISIGVKAATHTVTIAGLAYAPNTLTVSLGDVVTIEASSTHPLAQVDQATWNAGGTTTISGGFGTQTTNQTFTITNTNTIYYVCTSHVGMGMKGQIGVAPTGLNEYTSSFSNLVVFPNPASTSINVSYDLKETTHVSFELVSMEGRVVASIESLHQNFGTQTQTLFIPSTIARGMYVVRASSNKKNIAQKLVSLQ